MRFWHLFMIVAIPYFCKCCDEFSITQQPILSFLFCQNPPIEYTSCLSTCLTKLNLYIINLDRTEGFQTARDRVCSVYEESKDCIRSHPYCRKSKHIFDRVTKGFGWACSVKASYPFEFPHSRGIDLKQECNMCPIKNITLKMGHETNSWMDSFAPYCESMICHMVCLHEYMDENFPPRIAHSPISALEAFSRELSQATDIQRSIIKHNVPNECKTIFDTQFLNSLLFDQTFAYDIFFMVVVYSQSTPFEILPSEVVDKVIMKYTIVAVVILAITCSFVTWFSTLDIKRISPVGIFRNPVRPDEIIVLDMVQNHERQELNQDAGQPQNPNELEIVNPDRQVLNEDASNESDSENDRDNRGNNVEEVEDMIERISTL